MNRSFIYILSNANNKVLYIGVTSDLRKRIAQHKNSEGSEFTKKYNVDKLVYFEEFLDIKQAIQREKQLKNWHRDWKLNLIESINPEFKDLFFQL